MRLRLASRRLRLAPMCSVVVLAVLATAASPAAAATRTWDGDGAQDTWNDPTNWDNDALPQPGDDVFIGPNVGTTVTLSGTGRSVGSVSSNGNVTLRVYGVTLTVTGTGNTALPNQVT